MILDAACQCTRIPLALPILPHAGHCCFRDADATCHKKEIEAMR